MRAKIAAPALLVLGLALSAIAQGPPRRGPRPRSFPRSSVRLADEATITRGEQIYTANCRFCHGADLRGGDSGGPNLLRSKLVFNDKEGELIGPVVIQGSNTPGGGMMPPIPMPPADIKALAAYLHKVQSTMRGQGNPPAGGEEREAERARRRRLGRQGLLRLQLCVMPQGFGHEGPFGEVSRGDGLAELLGARQRRPPRDGQGPHAGDGDREEERQSL
ncbi:MAG: c-type cytochrome [Bryobacterales bacterium]